MSESSTSLAWMLPLCYLLAAALTLAAPSRRWGIAQLGALAGLIGIAGAVAVALINHEANHDGAGLAVALLIAVLGCFITRFSQRYLTGEAGQQRYVLALLLTLAAVGTVVLADHLGLLVAAWTASSLGLHHLLTFYRDRLPAQIAAHKKFLVSRLAEVLLVCALPILHGEIGSLWLADINAAVRPAAQLHNVVGGKLGVFEGNGGDLRIGLPRQSVHDGEQWRHAPLRLSVFIEAPQAAIERVMAKHLQVRQLVEHEWLHLFRLGDATVERRHRGAWSVWARADAA